MPYFELPEPWIAPGSEVEDHVYSGVELRLYSTDLYTDVEIPWERRKIASFLIAEGGTERGIVGIFCNPYLNRLTIEAHILDEKGEETHLMEWQFGIDEQSKALDEAARIINKMKEKEVALHNSE